MAAKLEVKLNKILVIAVIARPINEYSPDFVANVSVYQLANTVYPKEKLPMSPKPALLQPNAC